MGRKSADDAATDAQTGLRQAKLVISNVLRWGVILSATIIALSMLIRGGSMLLGG